MQRRNDQHIAHAGPVAPAKYRKKPVVIDAMQWNGRVDCAAHLFDFTAGTDIQISDDAVVFIHTLEGVMEAQPGDWIIRGVKGEFYPCKPDIFVLTYEVAE